MPTSPQISLPKTKDPAEFEHMCRDILNVLYHRNISDHFELYGGKGQNQHGIDIRGIDLEKSSPNNPVFIVAQCKNYLSYNEEKLITTIEKDIARVNTELNYPVSRMIIMTSYNRTTKIQDYIKELNAKYPFSIEILFWDKLEETLSQNPTLINKYYPTIKHWPKRKRWLISLLGFIICIAVVCIYFYKQSQIEIYHDIGPDFILGGTLFYCDNNIYPSYGTTNSNGLNLCVIPMTGYNNKKSPAEIDEISLVLEDFKTVNGQLIDISYPKGAGEILDHYYFGELNEEKNSAKMVYIGDNDQSFEYYREENLNEMISDTRVKILGMDYDHFQLILNYLESGLYTFSIQIKYTDNTRTEKTVQGEPFTVYLSTADDIHESKKIGLNETVAFEFEDSYVYSMYNSLQDVLSNKFSYIPDELKEQMGRYIDEYDTKFKQYYFPRSAVESINKSSETNLSEKTDSEGNISSTKNKLPKWKTAYIEYINNFIESNELYEDDIKYYLLDINGDDTPELYIDTPYTYLGGTLCTFDEEISNEFFWPAGLSYAKGQNIFCDTGGHMDYYYDKIYTIQEGQIILLQEGTIEGEYDSSSDTIEYHYYWEADEVSEEEYQEYLTNIFDSSQRIKPFENDGNKLNDYFKGDYSGILDAINSFNN